VTVGKGRRAREARREFRAVPITPGSHLGDFGEERPALDLTFGWFGRTLRVNPDASALQEVEFLDRASGLDENDPRAYTAIKDQLRVVVHPADFDEFWDLALRYRQTQDDLVKILQAVFSAVAGHPTGRPGDSSPGPQTTPQRSGSDPVMDRLSKRPDLQLAVWRADQETAAATG
jgi:hypothetical protein